MILLLGGTAEAREIATALVAGGLTVTLSVATGADPGIEQSEQLNIRSGALDEAAFEELMRGGGFSAVVDATHPYAGEVTRMASSVCGRLGVPYYRYERPGVKADADDCIVCATDHADAAVKAFAFGVPVLLTTGSRNLRQYVDEARRTGVKVVARVLDDEASFAACDAAGLPREMVVAGRGPFSVEDNVALICRFGIGVIVTKDSGIEGGTPEKLEAARLEGCRVVMVERPRVAAGVAAWGNVGTMVESIINAKVRSR